MTKYSHLSLFIVLAGMALFGVTTGLSSANVTTGAYVVPSTPGVFSEFAISTAVSGDTMVVGPYVFVRRGSDWIQQARLEPSVADEFFGMAVAISGDTIVVGSPAERNALGLPWAGAVYVFVRNGETWTQQARLAAPNGDRDDFFGRAVAISGDFISVGAYGEDSSAKGINGDPTDNSALDSGAAYVFVRNGTSWSLQAYVKASNTDGLDLFGWAVAMSGHTLVVGARNEAANAGAAYVFVYDGHRWSQQTYLKASNADAGDHFGASVSISGDTIAVGADFEASSATGVNGNQSDNSLVGTGAGAAYVFVRHAGAWRQQAYLKASNTDAGDFFGASIAVSGNLVIVGAPREDSNAAGVNGNDMDDSAVDAGAAYVFVREGARWRQLSYLKPWNANNDPSFPFSYRFAPYVAADDNVLAVCSPGPHPQAPGAVYVFEAHDLPPPDSDFDGVLDLNDECSNTAPDQIVDATGCSIDQLVPCHGPWHSHGEFLQALREVTADFVAAGLITEAQRNAILKAGARADCGR